MTPAERVVLGAIERRGPIPFAEVVDTALYDPTTIVVGSSLDFGRLTVEIDTSYAVWSASFRPYVFVRASLPGRAAKSATKSAIGKALSPT